MSRARRTILSPCRAYRYCLWRKWGGLLTNGQYAVFVGLNPSTADEREDDPTIRRCVAYAKAWGYDALCMLNLFAFRATDPRDMQRAADPVGPENDEWIVRTIDDGAGVVVAAWGCGGSFLGRDRQVWALVPGLHCLRVTKDGHPQHPLYLPKHLTPIPWEPVR